VATSLPSSAIKDTTFYWRSSEPLARFPKLAADGRYDVVVIGAGIVGVTAARRSRSTVCESAWCKSCPRDLI
jgi:hypothetical protein